MLRIDWLLEQQLTTTHIQSLSNTPTSTMTASLKDEKRPGRNVATGDDESSGLLTEPVWKQDPLLNCFSDKLPITCTIQIYWYSHHLHGFIKFNTGRFSYKSTTWRKVSTLILNASKSVPNALQKLTCFLALNDVYQHLTGLQPCCHNSTLTCCMVWYSRV